MGKDGKINRRVFYALGYWFAIPPIGGCGKTGSAAGEELIRAVSIQPSIYTVEALII